MLACMASCFVSGVQAKTRQTNVLILFSDELAPEYLSCYGGSIATPALDRLAAEGLRFTHAYAGSSMCTPSRFALLTGKYPGRCRDKLFLKAFPRSQPYSIAWNTYLAPTTPTIAQTLRTLGYLTGMVGKCHFARLPQTVQLPKFSAEADPKDPIVNEKLKQRHAVFVEQSKAQAGFSYANSIAWDNLDKHPVHALRHHNFPWMTRGAVEFLKLAKQTDQPFFLYVATTAVHGPAHADEFNHDLRYTPQGKLDDITQYEIPKKEIDSMMRNIQGWQRHRRAGMASLNHHVKLILQKLDELDLAHNTLVIFMADHNIEPGKATCFDKGNIVPTLMRWPGKIRPGTVTHALVQSVDIFPTVMAATGLVMPPGRFDGVSLLPLFRDPRAHVRQYVYLESGYARGITDGRSKYIALRFPGKVIDNMQEADKRFAANYLDRHKQAHSQIALTHFPHYFDPDQLYNLDRDPYEQKNVFNDPQYNSAKNRLIKALQEQLETFDHPYTLADIPFMHSDRYQKMAENTRSIGTDYIQWLPRDHGQIIWPPK